MGATAYRIEGAPPTGADGERRTWLLVVGIVLLVVGLVAGIVLLVAASNRRDDAVTGLAWAPVGCTTTLNFSETGDFLIFVETEGVLEGVQGDCDAVGAYRYTGDEPPAVALSMTDSGGDELDLPINDDVDYGAAGFSGRSERAVTITSTGDHLLTVAAGEGSGDFAIAVGKDPNSGVATLQVGAVLVALIGLIAGIVCIVLGNRRRPATSTGQAPGWPAGSSWTQSPPGAPPAGWTGAEGPPVGPPQGWPSQPPVAQPPPEPTIDRPPVTQPPGTWPTAGSGAVDAQPTAPWSPRPDGLSRPASTTRPNDGASGDGERSPWAPPQEE